MLAVPAGQHDGDVFRTVHDSTTHHQGRGNYFVHLHFLFLNFKRIKCMCEDTEAHLFLNPNDVKGFPFELQLANIRPARNRQNMLLLIYALGKRHGYD